MKLTEGFNLLATAPDGIKRLRELILSLAVQGKLVPQDPNDEPASELLNQIRAEKQRLVAEGKIKKDKPLPAIGDDEKPFALPEGWEWCRLADIASFENGDRSSNYPSKAHQVDSGTPFVNAGHLINQRVDFSSMNFITPERFELLRSGKVRKGDFLYCLRGSLGKFALVDFEGEAAIASSLIIVRFTELQNTAFVEDYLASSLASGLIRLFDNGTAQPNLSGSDLAKFVFPLPPLAEQSRIVAKVEELMALCDALETRGQLQAEQHARLTATLFDALAASESAHQLQENWARLAASFDLVLDRPQAVDALEQTILQLAVRGLLVPQDPADEPARELLQQIRAEKDRLIAEGKIKKDKPLPAISDEEKPFDLPEGWEWVRLGDVSNVLSGNAFASEDFSTESGIRAIKITNAGVGELVETEDYLPIEFASRFANFAVATGDLILALTRPYISTGLKISLCPESYDGALLNQRVAAIRCGFGIDNSFAFLFMSSPHVLNIYQERFGGSGLQPNLKVKDVTELLLPLPPFAEQSRIVARVEALRTLCGQLRQRLAASRDTQAQLASALLAQG